MRSGPAGPSPPAQSSKSRRSQGNLHVRLQAPPYELLLCITGREQVAIVAVAGTRIFAVQFLAPEELANFDAGRWFAAVPHGPPGPSVSRDVGRTKDSTAREETPPDGGTAAAPAHPKPGAPGKKTARGKPQRQPQRPSIVLAELLHRHFAHVAARIPAGVLGAATAHGLWKAIDLRLSTLPGEQGQVDWGHFGKLRVGKAERNLMAFVMVLSWSRMVYLRFFLDARMPNFLRGHELAFETFGGVPRVLLYDNLKSAVLERVGDAIRFNEQFLRMAAHYRFAPRPCAPGRGNEKGRVERQIRFIRDSFFAARTYKDLDDLNAQAAQWCEQVAATRPCPGDRARAVRDVFAEERPRLMTSPETRFPCDEIVPVQVGKTPYVRFDLNDYSVPHTHVRRQLAVVADLETVRVVDGPTVVAEHARSWSRDDRVEEPAHVEALVAEKRAAHQHRGMDRLQHAAPHSREFLLRCADRGQNLGNITWQLGRLLEQYGAAELDAALAEANTRELVHPPCSASGSDGFTSWSCLALLAAGLRRRKAPTHFV
ncbi:MAG: IS21 family transposase [Dehalococcoidia bacterium]|nr:IS21 family transposase [Dehalococcoidia bacterium]